jgi:transposase
MTLYIGVDYHPYRQTVAKCESENGEIEYREFLHSDKQSLKAYYGEAGRGAVVGVEATGSLQWFERMLFDKGIELRVGDPRLIRRAALSRHKNDFRDAETILELLMSGRFPRIEPRSDESRGVLQMLNYRHTLVRQRTSIANQMQAFARSKGLKKFAIRAKAAKESLLGAAEGEVELLLTESRFSLYEELTVKIKVVEDQLEKEVDKCEEVKLLQTHSGVGKLTALAVLHTLGDVRRFSTRDKVAAFVGLDPLDHSSGERRRIGKISKHGSRLLRHLLGQAAQASKDTRLRQFYSRVSRRRGHAIAKVATARKLLVNCYVMLRDNITYQEFRRRGEVGLCESSLEPETVSDPLIARPAIFE